MNNTIGSKISTFRKQKGFTQDELAEMLGVSPQAVSKWENDISCPDIMLLPQIAEVFETTTDDLLSTKPKQETRFVQDGQRKSLDEMMFKVIVNSVKGDKVRVNLPMPLIKMALELGIQIPQISGNVQINETLKTINVEQILLMVEKGVIGKLVEVESAEGDIVEVMVE
jgi:transcriptional regulator with XRE-family HTH domain